MIGGVVGGVLGCIQGAVEGNQLGLTTRTGYIPFIIRSGVRNAVTFGGFLGVYTGVKKYSRYTRDQNDLFNSFIAGAVAGALGAARSRSALAIGVNAIALGGIMTAFDAIIPNKT